MQKHNKIQITCMFIYFPMQEIENIDYQIFSL